MEEKFHSEIEDDDSIPPYLENDPGPPGWLFWSYIILPIGGIIALFLFWNGSFGWLDRGYWQELQKAANTVYPTVDKDIKNKAEEETEGWDTLTS